LHNVTNLDLVISVLATHREARRWSDEVVAADLLAHLGLDAAGDGLSDPHPLPDGPATHETETKHYSDGSSATGVPPLPDMSPEQQAEAARAADYRVQLDTALTPAAQDAPHE
jgi:hypothetical protein